MIDNIPYRMATDYEGNKFLYMYDKTLDHEYVVETKPNYDGESKFVTIVNVFHPIMDLTLDLLEMIYTDTEQEAWLKHEQTLAKWDNISFMY